MRSNNNSDNDDTKKKKKKKKKHAMKEGKKMGKGDGLNRKAARRTVD